MYAEALHFINQRTFKMDLFHKKGGPMKMREKSKVKKMLNISLVMNLSSSKRM